MLPVGFWFLASPVGYSNRSCCHSGRVVLEFGSTVFLYSALEMLFLSGRCWWLCFFVWHCGVCFGCPLFSLLLLDPAGGGWGRVQPPTPTFLCCHFCFRSFLVSCLREHAPPWGLVVETVTEALSYGVAGLLRGNCFRKRESSPCYASGIRSSPRGPILVTHPLHPRHPQHVLIRGRFGPEMF